MLTLNELKQSLEIGLDDPSSDRLLNQILTSSMFIMENYIQNKIAATDLVEQLRGTESRFLALHYYPIISIQSIIRKDDSYDLTNEITLEDGGSTGLISWLNRFSSLNVYEVSYRAGYETIPPDIEYAQLLLCQHLYYQTDRIKGGVQSVVTPDGSYVYDTNAIPLQVKEILDKHRRWIY